MTEFWIQPLIGVVFLVVCGLAGDILICSRKAVREMQRTRSY